MPVAPRPILTFSSKYEVVHKASFLKNSNPGIFNSGKLQFDLPSTLINWHEKLLKLTFATCSFASLCHIPSAFSSQIPNPANSKKAPFSTELEEHIDYWYQSLKADKEDFMFALTENSGDIAMVLITSEKTVYINKEAREKLSQIWLKAYTKNMNRLIPMMAAQLANGIIAVNGVKTMPNKTT